MIQIITYDANEKIESDEFVVSKIASPKSLDEFDYNFIDLRSSKFWYNSSNNYNSINKIDDLIHLSKMILNRKKTCIIILLPQNINFNYFYGYDAFSTTKKYLSSVELKNILSELQKFIFEILSHRTPIHLLFERTHTKIGDSIIPADFYFDVLSDALTCSDSSEKPTTIKSNNLIFTSLDLQLNVNCIHGFLYQIGLLKYKQEEPSWFSDIVMYDDSLLINNLNNVREKQEELVEEEKRILQNLEDNNKSKSILYTNGDELVIEVFNILEDLLDCDLSEFTDIKKEDFEVKKEDFVFIGEIKGVTSNIKNLHISQLDVHVQNYLDKLTEANNKNVKGLLIITPQRERPLEERDEIGEAQIQLAKRNHSLIITTYELLKLHEKFKDDKIKTEEIIKRFSMEEGLF